MPSPYPPHPLPHVRRAAALTAVVLFSLLLLLAVPPSNAHADETSTPSARVIYHFIAPDQLEGSTDPTQLEDTMTSVCSGELWEEGSSVVIRANAYHSLMPVSTEHSHFRVIEDYASTSATGKGAHDITEEASYDAGKGTVSLPNTYAKADLTVVWYVSADLQTLDIPLQLNISKNINGTSSRAELTHLFKASEQNINLKLFDDAEKAALVRNITIRQGGQELTQYVYQNGSISLVASPLGGPISIELDDETETLASTTDTESAVNVEPPLISLFGAANPVVGERFALDANSALIRTCERGSNMASMTGWPEKSGTYGFTVHFNHCVNPEVVNADQRHVAPGGTVHTANGGNYDYNWIRGMHFAWGDCYGDVDNNGAGEPRLQSGWVQVTNVDYATQTVSYRFFLDVCSDIDGHNMQSIMGTFQIHEDLVGYLELKKQSELPDISTDNNCYSLEGARYGIYGDRDCTDLKTILTTDAQGYARSKALPVGTYYVKELSAPAGFVLDSEVHEAKVAAGTTRALTLEEVPQSDPAPFLLAKHDSDHTYNSQHNDIQGGASSFLGAEFTVTFHPTLEKDYTKVKALRTWVMRTDEHGFIDLRKGAECKVSGDDLFTNTKGEITLPIGTYEIRETKAPTGYLLNESVTVRTVTSVPNGSESVSNYDPPIIVDDIIRGGIELEKRDAESGLQSALGAATLDGTKFTITNDNAHSVRVNGTFYEPGEVCVNLSVKDGKASIAPDTLPYGEYTLREISAGDGYNASDSEPRSFFIEDDGRIVRFSDSDEDTSEHAFKNQVKRGDLNFIKVRESTGERLAGIPFKIASKTTGEAHVVVSDTNGVVDTSASWIAHTYRTNANDSGTYSADNGVWFGKTRGGSTTEPHDDLGALPFDTYTIEELPCDANDGLELVTSTFAIYRDQQHLDFGVIENHDPAKPWISTVASDGSDHDKLIYRDAETVINDHVRYGNLKEGEAYSLHATLIDKSTGEKIPTMEGETSFTASSGTSTVEVSIPADLSGLTTHDIVVYETLFQGNDIIVEHHEPDNSEQTVSVIEPRIGTTAVDAADGDHEVLKGSEAQIVDTIHYSDLIPGKEYTLTGTIMMKQLDEEGNADATELLDEQGNAITSTTTFTPQSNSGSIEIPFTFDSSVIEADTELVVFERLTRDDTEVANHCDPDDEDQTVRIVEVEEPPITPDPEGPVPSDAPLPEEPESFFAKTGSAILPWLIGFATVFTGALILVFLAYRQHRKAEAVTAAIARNMISSHDMKKR